MGTLFIAAEQGMVLKSYDGENWTYSNTGYKGTFWTGIVLNNGTCWWAAFVGRSTGDRRRADLEGIEVGEKVFHHRLRGGRGKIVAAGLTRPPRKRRRRNVLPGNPEDDRLPHTALCVNAAEAGEVFEAGSGEGIPGRTIEVSGIGRTASSRAQPQKEGRLNGIDHRGEIRSRSRSGPCRSRPDMDRKNRNRAARGIRRQGIAVRPERLFDKPEPLKGVRVLEVCSVVLGPPRATTWRSSARR